MRIEAFLQQSPIFQTSRIARRMDASLNLVLEGEGVSAFEALVLAAIFFEKRGQIKPSALAGALEAKGLVEQKIDPEDARAVQLLLKPLGKRRAVRVMGILDRMQKRFEDGVGAQKLETMLAQMAEVQELCARMAAVGR